MLYGFPIIAVLNGKVYGGGIPIALWCDIRIATSDCNMHFGNISRGMSPAGQLSQLLREYLSPSDMMENYLENIHWNRDDLLRMRIASHVALSKHDALFQAKRLAAFVAQSPTQAVCDTLHLLKIAYAQEVADEESWLIAKKIANVSSNAPFSNKLHRSFSFGTNNSSKAQVRSTSTPIPKPTNHTHTISTSIDGIGIIAMETYTPSFIISTYTLEQQDIRARSKAGQDAVAVWDSQEDSISMAMNALSTLLTKHVKDPYTIGRLEVGTESNVDMEKFIKSYLMTLLPTDHTNVEGVDNINACYGGTAALLNTICWCRETRGYGIVVVTDTADMNLEDSAWCGASAVAILCGTEPWVEIHPEQVSYFKNTSDFLKPRYATQVTPHIDTNESMDHYIEALDSCIGSLNSKHLINVKDFDVFVFHGGLCATFMKVVGDI